MNVCVCCHIASCFSSKTFFESSCLVCTDCCVTFLQILFDANLLNKLKKRVLFLNIFTADYAVIMSAYTSWQVLNRKRTLGIETDLVSKQSNKILKKVIKNAFLCGE